MGTYTVVFTRSFKLALIATVICVLIGYPVSYMMSKEGPRFQRLAMVLIMLPMWMNFLLRTYSWMAILENNGLLNQLFRKIGLIALYNNIFGTDISFFRMINTQGAVVLGMVYNYLPFMILPIYSVIVKLDHSLIEAARDLGANSVQVFRRVILPLSLPGVLSGITMVFVPSVSTFAISKMLGGGTEMLLGDLIEQQYHGRRVQSLSGRGHLPCDDGDRGHLHGGHEPLRRGRRTGGDDVKKNNSFLDRLFMALVFVFLYAPIVAADRLFL